MLDFSAGKYAPFVWPAYIASVLIFVLFILDTLWKARHWRREVERLERDPAKENTP
jgi:heme exporter protein D